MIDQIIEMIRTITHANGYPFGVDIVSTERSPRPRSVYVYEANGTVCAEVNADGRCRDAIEAAIAKICGDTVCLLTPGDHENLKIHEPEIDEPETDDPEPAEENDDAIT